MYDSFVFLTREYVIQISITLLTHFFFLNEIMNRDMLFSPSDVFIEVVYLLYFLFIFVSYIKDNFFHRDCFVISFSSKDELIKNNN